MKETLLADFEIIFEHSRESLERLKGRRLLLTGGTGFFGKWILGFLNYANLVKGLGLRIEVLSRDPERFLSEFPEFNHELIGFIQGDVRTFSAQGEVDFVIHAATEASAKLNDERPGEMFDVIVAGTKHVFEVCKGLKSKRIILTSAGAVYGTQAPDVTHQPDESMTGPDLHQVGSAYAEGKRVSELLGAFHHRETGQEVVFARCFAFVGPYLPLDTHFAVGNFIRDCLQGSEIVIKGDGTPHRSYMYAADLVIWLLKMLTYGKNLRSYNVGSEESLSIEELAQAVSRSWESLTGRRVGVRVLGKKMPGAPVLRYVPRVGRANAELGLGLVFNTDQALAKTLTWNLQSE